MPPHRRPQNADQLAFDLYTKAALNGSMLAKYELGCYYLSPRPPILQADPGKAFDYFKQCVKDVRSDGDNYEDSTPEEDGNPPEAASAAAYYLGKFAADDEKLRQHQQEQQDQPEEQLGDKNHQQLDEHDGDETGDASKSPQHSGCQSTTPDNQLPFTTPLQWCTFGANRGNANCQFELAQMYYEGHGGVDQDYALASYWVDKAFVQGQKDAPGLVGKMQFRGVFVRPPEEEDPEE